MRNWVLVSASAAPVALIGGWTLAQARQSGGFNPVSDTISALAARGADDAWIMTVGLFVLGVCHVVTAAGLTEAAPAGRILLALGGAATIVVAASPQPAAPHIPAAAVSFGALALWPAFSALPDRRSGIVATAVMAVLLGWLGFELRDGDQLGLSERLLAGFQALWPLFVVLVVVRSRGQARPAAHGGRPENRAAGVTARLGSRVAPRDLVIAAGALVVSISLPPAGRAASRTPGLDPADLAARGWDSLALVVLACLLLVWRRQWPVVVWLAILVLTAADTVLTDLPSRCLGALMVAVYTVAVRTDRRTTLAVAGATAVTLIIPTLLVTGGSIGSDAMYALAAFSALAAAIGDAVRNQRASVESALARAEAAEASREEEARRRVAEERLRIARELHDAVAHHVSVINVQAGVASHLLESEPSAARAALVHVRGASQEVIEEMRVMVGLLRTDGNAQLVEPPTPGLTEIPGLVARMRSAGLDVELDDRVGARDLPTTTGLTAYRVIQEALTNAGKYGTGTARVVLAEEGPMLHVEVSNPAASPAGGRGAAGEATGHGLIGMRERVAAAGGTIAVTSGAMFHIRVDLPLERVIR